MTRRLIAALPLVAALALSGPTRALADADGLVGGIIGGIIGGVIVNEGNKQRRTTTTRTYQKPRSTMSEATRQANREVQIALNYFGFPVGTPDGVLGQRSRGAAGQYQALLGYPPTGQLTDYERTFLVSSYQRAVMGGPVTAQQIAANPMGPRGLLLTYRDEMAGIAVAAPSAPPQVAAPVVVAAPTIAAQVASPEVITSVPEPAPAAPAATLPLVEAATALPNFLAESAPQASLASTCNKVSLETNTNGGFTTLATLRDPAFALSEQFCLARTYAISQGEDLAARVPNVTPAQIAKQCEGLAPALKDHVTALSLQPAAEVIQGVSSFALNSGMSPQQLAGTARICLSVGYRTDNMDVAIGSALILTALGERPYGELLGHHLSQGFGATRRPDLALDWYDLALGSLASGGTAVFVPGDPGRAEVLRAAAYGLGGRPLPGPEATVPAALPSFNVGAGATP